MAKNLPPPQRILLIDDEPLILRVIRLLLEADGHQVTVAGEVMTVWRDFSYRSRTSALSGGDDRLPNVRQ